MSFSRVPRLVAVVAILCALLVTVPTAVSAAAATIDVGGTGVAANGAGAFTVPFSCTPGQAATVTLNLTANNNTPVEICVSDNGGPFIPTGIKTAGNGTASGTANYIQSGTYTFGAFTTTTAGPPPSCSGEILGARVIVQRKGPTGSSAWTTSRSTRMATSRSTPIKFPDLRADLLHEWQWRAEAGQPAARPGPARLRSG